MVPQDTDFPNPVADAPPQAQEEEDTNAVVSPTHSDFLLTKIGAKVAALPFVWAFFAVMGVGLAVSYSTQQQDKSVLAHVNDICLPAGCVFLNVGSIIAVRRVTATGGQLASLGSGETKISERSYRALRRGHARLLVPAVFVFLVGLLTFVSMTRVGTRSKMTGRLITPSYVVVLFFAGWNAVGAALTIWPLWLTLKMASVLVADAVSETRQKIERCNPVSAEWELEVMPSVLGLCTETLPALSDGWGAAVGTGFAGFWLLATGYFAVFLESGTILSAIVVVLFIMAPLGMSYEAASASSDCDLLSDALTNKRMNGPNDDQAYEHALCRVERILDRQNTKQGLGFVVGERVVDLKTLNNITATIFGIGTTVVPILFSLRPNIAADDATTSIGACEVTELQNNMVWSLFRNSTCGNLTIDEILKGR